ncbi:coagulation factor VII-like [Engraulis encrasicolus]|uniref:coagulation factor VII-like n=1 Tax=Engraulis encrasicolus TaxID=184585 RepID=UPI002FCE934A
MDFQNLICFILLLYTITGCVCGTGIVGGTEAPKGKWPWMVYLEMFYKKTGYRIKCGATLVTKTWLLTAAHCTQDVVVEKSLARVGELSLSKPTGQEVQLKRLVRHPKFRTDKDAKLMYNDVALVELAEEVKESATVKPVKLASTGDHFNTQSECWVTGWGYTAYKKPLEGDKTLRQVQLPLVSDKVCKEIYPDKTEAQLCAGDVNGGRDACFEDSGGPLVCRLEGSKEAEFVQTADCSVMLGVWVCVVLLVSNASGSLRNAVIGGHDAKEGRWPWMVYVHMNIGKEPRMCGGSLLNDQWVLTAAHCGKMSGSQDANIHISNVRVGVWKLKTRTGKAVRIARFVTPDDFKYLGNGMPLNDIALLQLQEKVDFKSLQLSSVMLPGPLEDYSAKTNPECWVTGWGYITETTPLPGDQTLQELQVPLLDDGICRSMYPTSTDQMLCAGFRKGGKDACMGDSGGPLVCKSSAGFVQVGVVSFGDGCAKAGKTGVYTRVQPYLPFIEGTIAKYSSP